MKVVMGSLSRVIYGALVATVAWTGSVSAQDSLRIAAVVNDEAISALDLSGRTTLMLLEAGLENRAEVRQRMAPQVLRVLIDDQLKLQEAKRLSIKVTKAEIDEATARLESINRMPSGGLESAINAMGVRLSVVTTRIEADLSWVKVVQRRAGPTIDITDEDVNEAVASIEANRSKPESRLSEIFLPVEGPAQAAEARANADRLVQQLRSGGNFGSLARNFSQSGSAATGGDLGWVASGQLGAEIDAALAQLQPNQISDPVETLSGFYILLLHERRQQAIARAEEATVSLQQLVVPVSANASPREIEGQTTLARTIAEVAASCQDLEAMAKEVKSPTTGAMTNLKVGNLSPRIRDIISGLNVGQASAPQPIEGGIAVVMVCDRTEEVSGVDRRAVERLIRGQRLEAAARRFIRELRRGALVDIRI